MEILNLADVIINLVTAVLIFSFGIKFKAFAFFRKIKNRIYSYHLGIKQRPLIEKVERISWIEDTGKKPSERYERNPDYVDEYDKRLLAQHLKSPKKGNFQEINKRLEDYEYQMHKVCKKCSGFYSLFSYNKTEKKHNEVRSVAFGGGKKQPEKGSSIWEGHIVGYEIHKCIKVTGQIYISYNFSENSTEDTVDIDLYNINYEDSFETENEKNKSFERKISVSSNGSFSYKDPRTPRVSVEGCFYGTDSEESTGVFEIGYLSGAWFAKRVTK